MKVALVAVCLNKLEITKKFLESVVDELDSNYDLYLLDNGSSDGTYDYLDKFVSENNNQSSRPFIYFRKTEINRGFAGGNNILLEWVLRNNKDLGTNGADYYSNVILINNDTLITKDCIDTLVSKCNSREDIGAVGPIGNNVGGIQAFNNNSVLLDINYKATAYALLKEEKPMVLAGMLVGYCLCIKIGVLKQVGLLDEQFGIGTWEDNDYSLRIRNLGYKLYVIPNVLIYHYGSTTIRDFDVEDLMVQNKAKFLKKYETNRPLKLVGLCRVKNGGEIFRKCLSAVSKMVDTVIVFDDNSTDNTKDIATSFDNVVYHKSEYTTLNEARDRQWLIDKAREIGADWCWMMDHDELPEESLRDNIRSIINFANPETDLYCFKICHLWDSEDYFRTDGLWGNFWQGRLFRLRKDTVVLDNNHKGDANYHCTQHGEIPIQCIESLCFSIYHYGNMDKLQRLKKYLWYTANDKEKDLSKVLGGWKDYYTNIYARMALNAGCIKDLSEYEFSDTDAYRHIINISGITFSKVQNNRIALSMIVKDESKYIRKCLDSLKGLVHEIVIVDTGSKDSTKEICKQYTDNVYDYVWNNDFADARNYALSKVSKDCNWIVRLDADEELPKESKIQLYNAIVNDTSDVYVFPIVNVLSLKPYKTMLSKTARCFKNVEGIHFKGIVHEEIDDSIKALKLKVDTFDGYILHYGYIKNKDRLDEKFKFYENLALKEIEKNPNNFKPYYNLASHYTYLKDYTKAIEMYAKALELNKDSYMVWHDFGVARYYKFLLDNQEKLKHILNLFTVSLMKMPEQEFSDYKEKVKNNIKRIQDLILK